MDWLCTDYCLGSASFQHFFLSSQTPLSPLKCLLVTRVWRLWWTGDWCVLAATPTALIRWNDFSWWNAFLFNAFFLEYVLIFQRRLEEWTLLCFPPQVPPQHVRTRRPLLADVELLLLRLLRIRIFRSYLSQLWALILLWSFSRSQTCTCSITPSLHTHTHTHTHTHRCLTHEFFSHHREAKHELGPRWRDSSQSLRHGSHFQHFPASPHP